MGICSRRPLARVNSYSSVFICFPLMVTLMYFYVRLSYPLPSNSLVVGPHISKNSGLKTCFICLSALKLFVVFNCCTCRSVFIRAIFMLFTTNTVNPWPGELVADASPAFGSNPALPHTSAHRSALQLKRSYRDAPVCIPRDQRRQREASAVTPVSKHRNYVCITFACSLVSEDNCIALLCGCSQI